MSPDNGAGVTPADARAARMGDGPEEYVAPAPAVAPALPDRHKTHGVPAQTWTYRNAAGEPLFSVFDFHKSNGQAAKLTSTLWRDAEGQLRWRWRAPGGLRPLYGLQDLADRPEDAVLVVEGEAAADAARKLFPGYVVLSWHGAPKHVGEADWSVLDGRAVTLWCPMTASALQMLLPQRFDPRGGACHVVNAPTVDFAAPWPPGFSQADAEAALAAARAHVEKTTWPRGFHMTPTGLVFAAEDNGRDEVAPPIWVCDRLDVIAEARNEEGSEWSVVVEFSDRDGRRKREVIGKSEWAGDGVEVRRRLMSQGLSLAVTKAGRERLQHALSAVTSSERARFAAATGWRKNVYVLPHRTIGAPIGETVLYRGRAGATHYSERGSYDAWRARVAERSRRNAFLVFALSCAFAGPLMRMLGAEGGGFHVRGQSSSGKTTILRVAGSVWGGGGELGFGQSWRNTGNALEAVALAHNDNLLCLDELKQLDPSEAATAAYSLAAGVSKGRLHANAEMRDRPTWRTMVLSTGEMGLREHIQSAPRFDKLYAGQELRLIDLEADFERGLGAWQDIHDAASPADFSEQLKSATGAHFGHAGPLFLERIARDLDDIAERGARLQAAFLAKVGRAGDTGQAQRGAQRFAIAAAAGELAAALDIVPWDAGEASDAAAILFKRWATGFGRNKPREDLEAIRRVRAYLGQWRHSKFRVLRSSGSEVGAAEDQMYDQAVGHGSGPREGEARSMETAGYVTASRDPNIYHLDRDLWRDTIFKGMDAVKAAKALRAAGFLVSNGEGTRLTNKVHTPEGKLSFYSVSGAILGADDEPSEP